MKPKVVLLAQSSFCNNLAQWLFVFLVCRLSSSFHSLHIDRLATAQFEDLLLYTSDLKIQYSILHRIWDACFFQTDMSISDFVALSEVCENKLLCY